MGSTNVPANEDVNKVGIQCKTPDDGLFEFDIETSRFQELLTTLVDCKYKKAGCVTNDYVKDIKEHEWRCMHRTIHCPVQSTEDLCEDDILAINLVEHVNKNHNSYCVSTEDNFFSVPIDLGEEMKLSKLITIRQDILLCCLKTEDHKLHVSLLCIRNTNRNLNCEVILMADDVKWSNHKIKIPNSESGFNEDNEQSAVFDLEKLIQVRNVFSSITVRVECNVAAQENIAQSDDVLKKIICACCGDLLTSVYYECGEEIHMFCEICFNLGECYIEYSNERKVCNVCRSRITDNKLRLTLIDSVKEYAYPCQNQSLGCKQCIPRFSSNHELLCPYKVFKCHKCEFSGMYAEFISHLQETHTSDMVNTNIYNVTSVKNGKSCYMLAFGSVFLCRIINKRTCSIEWLSTSVTSHNFIFDVAFILDTSKKIILSVHSDTTKPSYKSSYFKCIYNMIKKTASFKLYEQVITDVNEICFTIRRK